MKKQPSTAKTPAAPTAKRLALKKDSLKDLAANRAGKAVKGGAFLARSSSGGSGTI